MKREDTPMWNDPAESEFVRDLLDAGRNAPAEYDVAAGLSTHLAHVQAGTPLPHWAKAGASGGMSTGALVAWIAVPVATAAIIASVYVATKRDVPPPSAAPQKAPVSIQAAPVDLAGSEAAALAVPQAAAPAPQPSVQAEALVVAKQARAERPVRAARSESAAKVLGSAKSKAEPSTASSIRSTRSALNTTATQTKAPSTQAQPTAQRNVEAAAAVEAEQTAQTTTVAPVAPAELDDSRLEREMRMLAVAQRVLSEDPERALRMADQGEREFPHSMFSAERQQVALLAMVKLGRVDEARRIGQPFLAKYPNAPWSARLRRALATGRVE